MTLKQYLKMIRMTITEAAAQLGVSRPYLTDVANGRHTGRELAEKIELWSGGMIGHSEILYPERYKDLNLKK